MAALHNGLDDAVRATLRSSFASDVANGERMPFVIPFSILGPFIVPTLWLTISQKRHPWIYTTRWLTAAVIVAINVHVAGRTSSANIAVSYATGLLTGWGIIYNLNMIIWTRPQETAARIVRRRRTGMASKSSESSVPSTQTRGNDYGTELRQRRGKETGSVSLVDGKGDENAEYEYVWEPFPHDAPWKDRFNWVLDLTTSFRGCGWNWAISSVPQPKPPAHVQDITPVDMASWPMVSSTGYMRCTSRAQFLRTRLCMIGLIYLIIDFLAITMAMDPYFVLGPDHPALITPPHLTRLPSILLLWLRQLMSLTAFLTAISGVMNANALLQYRLAPYILTTRDQLWHYPSVNGSFFTVFDRGLAGWWGAWWHQTFRAQFLAPATFLLREGYIRKGEAVSSIIALCISFGQSGMLHSFGSWTSIPDTKGWRAPSFFILQVVGMIVEYALTRALPPGVFGAEVKQSQASPSTGSKTRNYLRLFNNFAFALLWVQWTSIFFCDDIASTGLWLCDPVPFSPLRMLGLGRPGDRWWRWDRYQAPGWYTGAQWWESGIAL